MGRIEGTGVTPARKRRRLRRPKWQERSAFVVVVIFLPVIYLAPTDWLRAVAIVGSLVAVYSIGYFDGRAAHALDDLRTIYEQGRTDDGRRDVPPA